MRRANSLAPNNAEGRDAGEAEKDRFLFHGPLVVAGILKRLDTTQFQWCPLMGMKVVTTLLMLMMLLFMAVQYNDPDGLFWMCVYSVPAIWCAVALLRRDYFVQRQVHIALRASIALSFIGIIYFWPLTPKFWRQEVWYEVETAREGMGLMIVSFVLLVVFFQARSQRRAQLGSLVAS